MKAHLSPKTVAEYCEGMEKGQIKVNNQYQRGSVWPNAARSSLVESIVLGYPIPKIFLYQQTDLKTKKTTYEIVDGQQRSNAIFDFYKGAFALSKNAPSSIAGCKYGQLDEDAQTEFLTYQLSIDVFPNADPIAVRESFRRMNSHTTVLNAEEKRHARWQGAMKWFIHGLGAEYAVSFGNLGVLTEKQIVRMADAKLIAEFIFVIEHGIQTTKGAQLDKLYSDNDKKYGEEDQVRARIKQAMGTLFELTNIHQTQLMKPYNFYLLLAAISHQGKPIPKLNSIYSFGKKTPPLATRSANLWGLAETLDEDEEPKKLGEFWKASRGKTNVMETKRIRFKTMCQALDDSLK